MKQLSSSRMLAVAATAAVAMSATQPLHAEQFEKTKKVGSTTVHYKKKETELLRAKGTVARYTVEKGQPHRLETLAGASAARLFDGFEETRKGCSN